MGFGNRAPISTFRNEAFPFRRIVPFLLITLLAFALRTYGLEMQSLWADEGTSVALAPRSLTQIARDASRDIHPPLYYITLHYWVKFAGTGVFAVRLLSAVYGTLLVAVTYGLGRRWFGPWVALVAGIAAAVSPFAIHYSQETRMYVLVALFGALSWLAFTRLQVQGLRLQVGRAEPSTFQPSTFNRYAVYWLLALATIYTHYFGVAIIIAQNVVWLVSAIRRLRKTQDARRTLFSDGWIVSQVSLFAAYLPWLYYSRETLLNWPATSESFGPLFLLTDTLRIFSLGPSVPAEWSPWLWPFLALILIALIHYVLRFTFYAPRLAPDARISRMRYTAAWLFVPLLLILLVSLDRPFYDPKFLLVAVPAFHLLLGVGVVVLGRWLHLRTPVVLAAVLFLLLAARQPLLNEWTDPRYWRDDYRGIARTIEATAGPDDAILLLGPGQIEILNYYYDGTLLRYPMPARRPIDPRATQRRLEQIERQHDRLYAVLWAQEESDPDGITEAWLDEQAFKASDHWYGDVRLAIYEFGDLTDQLAPVDARFGERLTLVRAAVAPTTVPAGDVVRVELEWQTDAPPERRLQAFAQLLDAGNHIVGQRDGPAAATPTTEWQPGERYRGRLGVPVLAGTPPGTYRLIVGLYDAETGQRLPHADGSDALQLAEVTVTRPPVPPAVDSLDLRTRQEVDLGEVTLLGRRVNKLGFDHAPETPLQPGEPLSVILFWQAEDNSPSMPALTLRLRGPDETVAAEYKWEPVDGSHPPSEWEAGEIVRDPHVRFLPGELPAGDYRLELVAENTTVDLGRIQVQ